MKSLISIQIIGVTKLLHAKQAQLLQLALMINLSSTKAIMLPPFPPELPKYAWVRQRHMASLGTRWCQRLRAENWRNPNHH